MLRNWLTRVTASSTDQIDNFRYIRNFFLRVIPLIEIRNHFARVLDEIGDNAKWSVTQRGNNYIACLVLKILEFRLLS